MTIKVKVPIPTTQEAAPDQDTPNVMTIVQKLNMSHSLDLIDDEAKTEKGP